MPVLLAVGAALYFRLGAPYTMEWTDQGQIVYPSWRVAEGAMPYRDFYHVYGPALFYVNGALLRVFGADLTVLRAALVLLKALIAALVYLGARTLAPWPFALGSYVLCVAVWGAPWWVFNTPYANHFALALTFAGMLLVARRGRSAAACLLAGLCFGVAALFKQTAGLFALVSLVLFLIWDTQATRAAPPGGKTPAAGLDLVARAARGVALVAALGLFALYLANGGERWNATLLVAPVGLSIALLGARELRGAGDPAARVQSLGRMLAAAAGLSIPLAACAAYYAWHGALTALVFNTVRGLPELVHWFIPLPMEGRAVALAAGLVAVLAGLRAWRVFAAQHPAAVAPTATALALVAVVAAAFLWRDWWWFSDVFRLLYAVPLALVWAALPRVVLPRRSGTAPPALAAFFFFAASSLLLLHPGGDLPHILMGLPAFLPLLAVQLARLHGAEPGRAAAMVSAACLTLLLLVLCAPFALALATAPAALPAGWTGFARAPGVRDAAPKFRDATELVRAIDAQPPARPLFAIANAQMLYFLAGRPSALGREEYLLYLVAADVIAADTVRDLLPPAAITTRLEALRPLVIDEPGSALGEHFRRVYPEVAAYIDAHTRAVRTAGVFRLLDWTVQ